MKQKSLPLLTACGLLLALAHPQAVHADLPTVEAQTVVKETPSERQWTLGLGLAAAPEFEGSEDYTAAPVPSLRVTNPSGRFIDVFGSTVRVNALASTRLQLGPLARYRTERDDVDNNRVDAMEAVDAALEVGAFGAASIGPWNLRLDVLTDVADGHDGLLMEFSGGYTWVDGNARLTLNGFTTYAGDNYMAAYFGVDGADSAASGLSTFDAEAGIKDVGITVIPAYSFSSRWGAMGVLRYTKLVGDAADSPVVEDAGSDDQVLLVVMGTYSF